jgi:DnaJ-class molecular chaperone
VRYLELPVITAKFVDADRSVHRQSVRDVRDVMNLNKRMKESNMSKVFVKRNCPSCDGTGKRLGCGCDLFCSHKPTVCQSCKGKGCYADEAELYEEEE